MTSLQPIRPALVELLPLVLDSVRSDHSKRAYAREVSAFANWCQGCGFPLTPATVNRYRALLEGQGKKPATVNLALSAIRKLAHEAGRNGLLDRETAREIVDTPDTKRLGVVTGNWLTDVQLRALLNAPRPDTNRGRRDHALLWLLGTAGLRRGEACSLRIDQLQEREGRPVLADVVGKGQRVRTIPIRRECAAAVRAWMDGAGIVEGPMLRGVTNADAVRPEPLSEDTVAEVVERRSREMGYEITPHDLRRTFGRLAYQGGADLKQIQAIYGHSSVATTEHYLRIGINFRESACDALEL
jgi:integrase/recombinase XerD